MSTSNDTRVKHIFTTAIMALFCATAFGVDDWKTYSKKDQIEIRYRSADCHDEVNGIHQQKILLQFINLSNEIKEVTFSKELIYSGSASVANDVKSYSLLLQPGETKEGLCSDKNKVLFIFSKQLNLQSRELEKFELKNISTKTIQ